MHIILFKNQKVSSKKIESKGFKFNFSNLEETTQKYSSVTFWHLI